MMLGSVPLFNIFAVLILMLESPEQKGAPSLKQLLKGVATNPILLGIITGTVFALLPVSLPAVATKTLNNLASVTTPLALLSIGASFEGAKGHQKAGAHTGSSPAEDRGAGGGVCAGGCGAWVPE